MERLLAIHPHDPSSARARVHDWRQQAGSRRRSSDNKYRFSDSEDYLESLLIVRSGLKAPLARSQMLRARTRLALAERLCPVKWLTLITVTLDYAIASSSSFGVSPPIGSSRCAMEPALK
jgi:hypothetical protein